ncbi:MAG: hypothetical protein A3G81_05000 [Betaproteobacteria bacterium RIFCSPLOWO2_12_FULL_65_14]|nr:MAG: hypothetical protein A3G81_05000 [Betaproteobacteria bacterium RIFCSPLOWO2_12_FULL_65_14]
MLKYGGAAMLILAGWAALNPSRMSWAYLAAVIVFEAWLLVRMRAEERGPVPVDEPPYRFTAEEAELVGRYRFYFTFPTLSTQAGSVLAAIGLSGMVLALWLTFRQAFVQGALIGLNLFAVGWFTKRVAPVYALRIAAARGKRDALRMLEIVEPVWAKINAANQG